MIHFFLLRREEGGSTSHPSRVGLDTCLFFWERGEWLDPVRLRARGSGGWWVLFFVWAGVFVLFVLLLFFLCGVYLTLALFWGRFGLLEFVVG